MNGIPFLHNSGSLLFCFTDMSSCEWLDITQKILQTSLENTGDLLCPSASRSILKRHVVLAKFVTYFWLVALSTGSNYDMLLCWQQVSEFQLLLFWYKLPQFSGDKLESFPQFFSNEVSNSVAFFLWILPWVSRLWALLFWKCIDFFTLHRGFLHIISFIEIL